MPDKDVTTVEFEKIFLELDPAHFKEYRELDLPSENQLKLIDRPSYELYRSWHDRVGKPYGWDRRPRIQDQNTIEKLLKDSGVQMYLFHAGGDSVGYALIESDGHGSIEISDFGFLPEFSGQGHGSTFFPPLLNTIITSETIRVWLSTRSTNDPRVVQFYSKFGFKEYMRETVSELVNA